MQHPVQINVYERAFSNYIIQDMHINFKNVYKLLFTEFVTKLVTI
jgi:hypothetical protein